MTVGNIVAIAQTNLKRMLAYSTIAHMGFLLLGFSPATSNGYAAAMFYMVAYVLTSLASFGMILLLSREGFEADRLDDFKGLNQRVSVVGVHDAADDVLAGRHAADDRLLRQVLGAPGGGAGRLRLARRGGRAWSR